MNPESTSQCTWCDRPVEPNDGWRAEEIPGERSAAFCRLEHVVPWELQGAHWEAGTIPRPSGLEDPIDHCARCGAELGEVRVLLVRHRGEHLIPDAFCSAAHMAEWAKAGGRWG